MFTLNRVTLIGLGAGLVLVGCASPIGETPDDSTATSTAALTERAELAEEEAAQVAETSDEAMAALPMEIASAFEIPERALSDDAMSHDAKDEKSDKWFGFGRFGWGGWAPGLYGFGTPGYAYGYAAPFGYGYGRTIGYGSTCGLYGCAVW